MAPHLPRSHRIVDSGVKEVTTVRRPRETVVDVQKFIADWSLSRERANGHAVAFVTFEVGTHRDPRIVGAHRKYAHGEEVVTFRFEVFVENHLLALERVQGINNWRREITRRAWYATADRVVETFTRALEVPPRPSPHRYRYIRLFDSALDLLKKFVFEGLESGERFAKIGVFAA